MTVKFPFLSFLFTAQREGERWRESFVADKWIKCEFIKINLTTTKKLFVISVTFPVDASEGYTIIIIHIIIIIIIIVIIHWAAEESREY